MSVLIDVAYQRHVPPYQATTSFIMAVKTDMLLV